jgi:hypothetical protein
LQDLISESAAISGGPDAFGIVLDREGESVSNRGFLLPREIGRECRVANLIGSDYDCLQQCRKASAARLRQQNERNLIERRGNCPP